MEIIIQETTKVKNPYRDGVIPITETVISYDSSSTIYEYPHVIRIGRVNPKHYYGRLSVITNSGQLLNSYESSSQDLVAIDSIALEPGKLYQFYREVETQALVLAICTVQVQPDDSDDVVYIVNDYVEYYVRGSLSALQFGVSQYDSDDVLRHTELIPYYNTTRSWVNVNIGSRDYHSVGEMSKEVIRNFNFYESSHREEITHIHGMFYLKEKQQ